jgi:hypothetical protein
VNQFGDVHGFGQAHSRAGRSRVAAGTGAQPQGENGHQQATVTTRCASAATRSSNATVVRRSQESGLLRKGKCCLDINFHVCVPLRCTASPRIYSVRIRAYTFPSNFPDTLWDDPRSCCEIAGYHANHAAIVAQINPVSFSVHWRSTIYLTIRDQAMRRGRVVAQGRRLGVRNRKLLIPVTLTAACNWRFSVTRDR